jgi:hypothetical protein
MVQIITNKLELRRIIQNLELQNIQDNTVVTITYGGKDMEPIVGHHSNIQMERLSELEHSKFMQAVDNDSAYEAIATEDRHYQNKQNENEIVQMMQRMQDMNLHIMKTNKS